MANLFRSAKSGSAVNWTLADLESYNIRLQQQETLTFFGIQQLPQPLVDPEILNNVNADDMQLDCHAELIHLLDLAMIEESAVIDFTVELFKFVGYVHRGRVARTRKDLRLLICGEYRHAKTDVCILDRDQNDILLLVREDKRSEDQVLVDANAQLVAEAVAAFSENNANRSALGLDPLSERVMPGIVMVGTSPTFFKIPITESLEFHIRHGTYPPDVTTVTYCQPPVPRPARRHSEGMKPLDNRRQILMCYEGFERVVGI